MKIEIGLVLVASFCSMVSGKAVGTVKSAAKASSLFAMSVAEPTHSSSIGTNYYQDLIQLSLARKITTGRSNVNVGVIDTGIDITNPFLLDLVNTSLSVDNSFNNDINSPFIEYNQGIPFGHWHGTCVSGIISSSLNQGNYVMGINSNVKLASLRSDGLTSADFTETYKTVTDSITYANNNSIDIVNYSGGFEANSYNEGYFQNGGGSASSLQSEINSYSGLIVVAAGNSGMNLDSYNVWPATFSNDNILVVGNSTSSDNKNSSSNYSSTHVDIFAPGTDIWTTYFGNEYAQVSGTSFSAPMVTGVAAMMKSVNPNLTASQIKSLIMNNVDQVSALSDKCVSGGRLNAFKAVRAAIPLFATFNTAVPIVQQLSPGQTQWYKLSLQANKSYTIKTTGSLTTKGYLYRYIENNPNVTATPGGYGTNFLMSNISYSTDRIMYLCIENVGPTTGTPSLQIDIHTHSYTYQYLDLTNTYHRAMCVCGAGKNELHAYAAGGTTCLKCGHVGSGGFIKGNESPIYFGNSNSSYIIPDQGIYIATDDINDYHNGNLIIPDYECDDCECEYC